MKNMRLATASMMAALTVTAALPRPVYADGAASTRNIIFGAAAIGGTLLILNHNKKVHEKYAEYDRRQAQTQAEANNAEAAYESEKEAYAHEASINSELSKEVAYQHHVVSEQQRQIASLEHSLKVAKYGNGAHVALAQPAVVRPADTRTSGGAAPTQYASASRPAQVVSYGWGAY